MSWFKTSNITSLAKSALKEAQKTIDKALDIGSNDPPSPVTINRSPDDHNAIRESSSHSINLTLSSSSKNSLDAVDVSKSDNVENQNSENNAWDWSWDKQLSNNIDGEGLGQLNTTASNVSGEKNSDNPTNKDVVANNIINKQLNIHEELDGYCSQVNQTDTEFITPKSPTQSSPPSKNEPECLERVEVGSSTDTSAVLTINTIKNASPDKELTTSITNTTDGKTTFVFSSLNERPIDLSEADDSGIWDFPNLSSTSIDFPVALSETTDQIPESAIHDDNKINVDAEFQSGETGSRPSTLDGIGQSGYFPKKSGYFQPGLSESNESTYMSSEKLENSNLVKSELQQTSLIESVDSLSFPQTPSSVEILTETGSSDDLTLSNETPESVELLSFPETPSSIEILNEGSSSDDLTLNYVNSVESEAIHTLPSCGVFDSSAIVKMSTEEAKKTSEMNDLLDSEISHDESLNSSASADSSHTLIGNNDNDVKRQGQSGETFDHQSNDNSVLNATENLEFSSSNNSSEFDSHNENSSTSNSLASWLQQSFLKGDEKSNEASLVPDKFLSGHTSADEIETTESTTTSSDIEIISSPNSENGQTQLSPGKLNCWAVKSNVCLLQNRADTPNSDGHGQTKSSFSCLGHQRKSSEASSESSGDNHCLEIERLSKKITELQGILDAREQKILELSKLNVESVQTNELLQDQIMQNNDEIKGLKDELRLLLIRSDEAKESLQKSIQEQVSPSVTELKRLTEEQEAVILELRAEGEKLSKQQFQQATHIKKLKSKEREMETLCNKLKSQIDQRNKEVVVVKEQLKSKEEADKKLNEDLKQATAKVNKSVLEVNQLRQEITEAESKNEALKRSLDLAYKDIADLHHKLATSENKAAEMSLSAEMAARQELQLQLQEEKKNNQMKLSESQVQLIHLHKTLGNLQQQSSMIEINLKAEIEELQKQLQESESKNNILSQDISNSTRPFLKQIENLQASFSTMQHQYELNEQRLMNQIDELEKKMVFYKEKERLIQEETSSASSRVSEYLKEIASKEAEINKLKADELQHQQSLKQIQCDKLRELSLIEESNVKISNELLEIKKAHETLLNQFESEKEALKYEKKKNTILEETIKEKNKKLEHYSSMESELKTPRDSPTTSLSKFSIASDSCTSNTWPDDVFENSARFYPFNNSTSVMECLQSQVKQKDGEVMQWQVEVSRLERVKESLAHEIASLNSSNIHLTEEMAKLREEKLKNVDLEQKYNTLLQLYGEKIEENQELKLDLIDIKDMYKSQIDELVKGMTK